MLTDEEKLKNKEQFLFYLSKLSDDTTELLHYLEAIDYFNQPATSQYEGSYAGGLCEQAIKYVYELGRLVNAYKPGCYTGEDIIKVALFKTLYRAEMYEHYTRQIKNDATGAWESVGAYRLREKRPTFGDLEFSSYMIAKKFISFTDEQVEAIMCSGVNKSGVPDIHDIRQSYPLVTLMTMAEMVTNYLK